MMLVKLSLKNIQKSIRDYLVYFITLVLGVSVFYVFNALENQSILIEINQNNDALIDLMNRTISAISVLVSIVLGFLIIYANQFLIKRRSKEIAMYMLLGMNKRKISILLFLETLIIGILSLCVGLVLGVFLSQLMSILVLSFFHNHLDQFVFIFSFTSCMKTILYFAIIYIVLILFNTVNINTKRLIDLINERKKNSSLHLKNPYICILIFVIACILLGRAYYLVTVDLSLINEKMTNILYPIGLGILSTFMIFFSLSGFILWFVQHLKGFYYKDLHAFIVREFNSKINTTVISTSIICLLLFLTICILSSGFTVQNSINHDMGKMAPVDIQFSYLITDPENIDENQLKEMGYSDSEIEVYKQDASKSLIEKLNEVEILDKLDDYTQTNLYWDEFSYKDFMGEYYVESAQMGEAYEEFIKLSEYNKLASLFGNETFTLKSNEYIVISDYTPSASIRNIALKNNHSIHVFNHDLYPKYPECKEGWVQMSGSHLNTGIIVVPDEIIDESKKENFVYLTANYKEGCKAEIKTILDTKMSSLDAFNDTVSHSNLNYITQEEIFDSYLSLAAMIAFVGLYLGIIFMLTSTALLSLKELSQIADDANQYQLLMKLGTPEKQIKKVLFQSIGIYFLFPLLLAIVHSIFGMKFAIFLLELVGVSQLWSSILYALIFLSFIYGGYFWITYISSKNIILKKQNERM